MKQLTLILALLFATNSWAKKAYELVEQGAAAYQAGEYGQALTLFDSANVEFTSAGLLYNIANCHFKLRHIPHAVLYYERAIRLNPADEDIKANLTMARQMIVDRVIATPGIELGDFWTNFKAGGGVDHWAVISLWSMFLVFVLLATMLMIRSGVGKRFLLFLAGLMLLFTILSVALAISRKNDVTAQDEAIIMGAKVEVLSEPRDNATELFILHEGTKVEVTEQQNGWTEVKLPNGNVGWLKDGELEVI